MLKQGPDIRLAVLLVLLLIGSGCSNQVGSPEPDAQPAPLVADEGVPNGTPPANPVWSAAEVSILRDLWLGSLPPLPASPSNVYADDPRAAALGHRLFFDTRLSANGQVACTTCHRPDLMFTDGQALSFGTRTTKRNARTIVGSAYSPWQLWDGHKDSLWAQAVEPIEHPDEQGTTRLHAVHLVRQDETYRALYQAVFGPLPDELADFGRFPDSGGPVEYEPYRTAWHSMSAEDQATVTLIFVNLGKAIEAYERLIGFDLSRFDLYAKATLEGDKDMMDSLLTVDEVAGLRLFIGKANCVQCHNGPLFTDNRFHNTGVPTVEDLSADQGRAAGVLLVLGDVFNCQGIYSDAPETGCAALSSIDTSPEDLVYSFRTPTLRSVTVTAPYMHAGQLDTLRQVLDHYNRAAQAPVGQTELSSLGLSEAELDQLEAFLRTLNAPLAASPELLKSPTD